MASLDLHVHIYHVQYVLGEHIKQKSSTYRKLAIGVPYHFGQNLAKIGQVLVLQPCKPKTAWPRWFGETLGAFNDEWYESLSVIRLIVSQICS